MNDNNNSKQAKITRFYRNQETTVETVIIVWGDKANPSGSNPPNRTSLAGLSS